MNEATIRRRHEEAGKIRVSRYDYECGDEITGTSKPCVGYVLSGRCTFASGETTTLLEPGDVLAFSGGQYTIRNDHADFACVVWVWELPAGFG